MATELFDDNWETHTKGRMITVKCQKCGKFFDYLSNYREIKFCPDCKIKGKEELRKSKMK